MYSIIDDNSVLRLITPEKRSYLPIRSVYRIDEKTNIKGITGNIGVSVGKGVDCKRSGESSQELPRIRHSKSGL